MGPARAGAALRLVTAEFPTAATEGDIRTMTASVVRIPLRRVTLEGTRGLVDERGHGRCRLLVPSSLGLSSYV